MATRTVYQYLISFYYSWDNTKRVHENVVWSEVEDAGRLQLEDPEVSRWENGQRRLVSISKTGKNWKIPVAEASTASFGYSEACSIWN